MTTFTYRGNWSLLTIFFVLLATFSVASPSSVQRSNLGQHGWQYLDWTDDMESILHSVLATYPSAMDGSQTGHTTIYGCHDDAPVRMSLGERLIFAKAEKLIKNLAARYKVEYMNFTNFRMVSIRILHGKGGVPPQKWHVDYGMDLYNSVGLLIPLTPSNENGTTELLVGSRFDYAAALSCGLLQSFQRTISESFGSLFKQNPEARVNCSDELKKLTLVQPSFSPRQRGLIFRSGSMIHRRGPQSKAMAQRVTLNIDFTTAMGGRSCNEYDFINRDPKDSIAPLSYVDNIFVRFDDDPFVKTKPTYACRVRPTADAAISQYI